MERFSVVFILVVDVDPETQLIVVHLEHQKKRGILLAFRKNSETKF